MNIPISKVESNAISIVRVLAMLAIVLCHFLQAYDNKWAWVLNAGVQVFLVLSGYLYGHKEVGNWRKWFISRFVKLYVPLYIYTTVALTSITLLSDTSVGLMPYLKAGGVDGLSHLWFMKAIAVSYLITPILQLGRKYPFCLFTLVLLIGFVEYAYLQINLFMFSWIWLYALGYYFAILTDKVKQIVISFITVLFIALSMNISWYDMLNYDGVYNRVWHDLGGVVLCLGGIIILTLCNITKIPKWIVLFDRNSFYLYITHHIYLIGPLSIVPFIHNIPMCILVTLFLIIVSSVLLAYISKIVINRINSKFL